MLREAAGGYQKKAAVNITECLVMSCLSEFLELWAFKKFVNKSVKYFTIQLLRQEEIGTNIIRRQRDDFESVL